MSDQSNLEHTADIVSAYVSNNSVSAADLLTLLKTIYEALGKTGLPPVVEAAKLTPAVSIRASIRPDHVTCLECGAKMKLLKRHLMLDHGLSPDGYRERWGLSKNHPIVAPEYAARRADLAKSNGLGRKKVIPPVVAKAKRSRKTAAPAEPA